MFLTRINKSLIYLLIFTVISSLIALLFLIKAYGIVFDLGYYGTDFLIYE